MATAKRPQLVPHHSCDKRLQAIGTPQAYGTPEGLLERAKRKWNVAQRHTLTLKCVNFVNFVNFWKEKSHRFAMGFTYLSAAEFIRWPRDLQKMAP